MAYKASHEKMKPYSIHRTKEKIGYGKRAWMKPIWLIVGCDREVVCVAHDETDATLVKRALNAFEEKR